MRRAKRQRTGPARRLSRRTRRSLLLVFALVFAPVAARHARAACVEFASPPAITAAADYARALATGDVDGDGDLDVLSASRDDDKIAWYANDGAGGGWTARTIAADANGANSVAVADVDGDGDLDALSASSFGNAAAWYENVDLTTPGTGDGTSWATHTISATAYNATAVAAGDFDGDGDDDALVGMGNFERVIWYANDGAGGGWTLTTIANDANGVAMVAAADVDGDGDLDALSTSTSDNEIVWFENVDLTTPGTGNGSSWGRTTISIAVNYPDAIAVADFDRDGNLDVASASILDDEVIWHENAAASGDGSTWTDHAVTTALEGAYGLFAADLDGDGDADLLSASRSYDFVAWFENDGDGGGWTLHTLASSADSPVAVAAGDVDGDGDTDALSATRYGDTIAWYRNDRLHGQALFAGTSTISALESGARSVVAGDVDGDGDLDAFSASYFDDTVAWHENRNGAGTTWSQHEISVSADGAISVFAADVDGDGDLDALASLNFVGDVAWYENLGGGGSWTSHLISTVAANPYTVVAADVDGDGDVDALAATLLDDKVLWYENSAVTGDGSTWTLREISATANGVYGVAAGDVDGDGDVDALSASGLDDKVAWYENLGGEPIAWTLHTISTAATGPYSVVAADVDGDGDLDALVASISDNTIAWFENLAPGNGSIWTIHVISSSASSARSVFAADVDGDGDTDALSASYNDSKIAWYENDGTPAVGAWAVHTVSLAATGARAVFAADVDGDGNTDALSASSLENKIAWYRNLGTHVHDDGFDSGGATTACWSVSVPPVP